MMNGTWADAAGPAADGIRAPIEVPGARTRCPAGSPRRLPCTGQAPPPLQAVEPREPDSLQGLRAELDDVDDAVVRLILRRCTLARAARRAQPRGGLAGDAALVRQAAAAARTARIEEETVRQIFWRLVDLGRRLEPVS